MCGVPCCGDTVFLRNHFTDNAKHYSNFNYVRDYLKAFHVVKNWTCAKSAQSALLTMCFNLDESDYYSFATSIASGLSRQGANTNFEGDRSLDMGETLEDECEDEPKGMKKRSSAEFGSQEFKKTRCRQDSVKLKNQVTLVGPGEDYAMIRRKLCVLMDVVFTRLAIKKFLVDDEKGNIYRLMYCKTKYSRNKRPVVVAVFAFILQVSLTLYVIFELTLPKEVCDDEPENPLFPWLMFPLALFTSLQSLLISIRNLEETLFSYRIYGKFGMLQMMDFIMSAIVPIVLTVTGFILIFEETSFIESVLNSTALLFIPEIDDQLPGVLGLNCNKIVKNFLVAETMVHLDSIAKLEDDDFSVAELKRRNITSGVQFSDYYITNIPEQGITSGTPFQPYQVTVDNNNKGHQIDPSSFVTKDCLLKRIEWKYTTGYPTTTTPRIGYLHLTKLDDTVVEIERKKDPAGVVGLAPYSHSIDGLFIITTFQMSEDILKLRVCGSYNPSDFVKAFECYSLWNITSEAKRAINSLPSSMEEEQSAEADV